jgi:hypothetical protein
MTRVLGDAPYTLSLRVNREAETGAGSQTAFRTRPRQELPGPKILNSMGPG